MCFMHSSRVVIVLFNTDLYKSAFSIYSFRKLVFRLSVFYHVCLFYFEFDVIFVNLVCNICVIIFYIGTKCFVIFSHQGTIKQEVQGLQAFAFFVVTVNDGHTKLRFKKKRRG